MTEQATSGSRIGLIFHGIGTPRRELEPGEAPYWISADAYARTLDRIAALPDPGRVLITFDDGNLSDLAIGLPLLRDRGLRASFFVLTGRIGQAGSLDVGDIRELQAAGMGIGSHGVDHRNWRDCDAATLYHELTASRARLEEICGIPIQTAAIPFGAYDGQVLRALRAAGYATTYSSDGGKLRPGAALQPRNSIRSGLSDADLEQILSGRMPPLRRLRRRLRMIRMRYF